MSQFLGIALFLVVALGFAIHTGVEFPWFFEWVGHLPGDVLIKKGGATFYVPLTSSALISVVLSFFFSLFASKK